MQFANLDCLSPNISLFYYGSKRHSSLFGAILTILLLLISIAYIIYLVIIINNHKISNFMSYRSYFTDLGHYYFNDSTGVFHYFQVYNIKNKAYGKFNPKYLRIIMSRLYKTYQNNQEELNENEHWVYDLCRQGVDNKNVDKSIFINNEIFIDGACLRYYYINNTYYSIEDKEHFKYPYLIHKEDNNKNIYLETVIEKCDNLSFTTDILGKCGDKDEMDEYLGKYNGIYIHLLDRQINPSNHSKPIYQYLRKIGDSLDINNVPLNNINLIPLDIEIQKGFLFPKNERIASYSFDINTREIWESKDNEKILSIFDYHLQSSSQVIKGIYYNFLDVLPNIGGFIHLLYFIFYFLNYLYNKYITIVDFNHILFRMPNTEDLRDVNIKKIFFEEVNLLRDIYFIEHNKMLSATEKRDSIYITKLARKKKEKNGKDNICTKSISNNEKNNKNYLSNSNDLLQSNNITVIKNIQLKNQNESFKCSLNNRNSKVDLSNITFKESQNIYSHFNSHLKEYFNQRNKSLRPESVDFITTSKYLNFFYFLLSLFNHPEKKRVFFILDEFRKKLLGEEHLLKSYTILFYLEKYFDIKEDKKLDIIDLYENL